MGKEEWEEAQKERSELGKEGKDQEGNGKVGGDWRQPLLIHHFATGRPGPQGLIQTLRNEDGTSFAPVLVGFLPNTSGFQQLDCFRGSLGSQGNYQGIPAGL